MRKNLNLFLKITTSLFLTVLFFLFITRAATQDEGYKNYFSKILTNFGNEFKRTPLIKDVVEWFNPTVSENSEDSFVKYKLLVVLKYLDNYFETILKNTQDQILDNNIENLKKTAIDISYYENFKKNLKNYLTNNKDLLEITFYKEDGEKLIGVKYKKVGGYKVNKELIAKLNKNNNLLLKHQNSSNLILLSLVKDKDKPFLIISQTIDKNFFSRILDELEVADNLFYFKDSDNFVILDNYGAYAYQENKKDSNSYDFYKTFVKAEDVNLSINLSNVDYSLGVVVERNNFWGNVMAVLFLVVFFGLSFLFIDWVVSELRLPDRILRKIGFVKSDVVVTADDEKKESTKSGASVVEPNYSSSVENRNQQVLSKLNPNALDDKSRARNRSIFLDIEDN